MAKQSEHISGLRKVAVLLVSLGDDLGSQIISGLEREDVERISMEVARLGEITEPTREAVLMEFYRTSMASQYLEQGGIDYARSLLQKSLKPEEAADILEGLEQAIQETPFHFLTKVDPRNLLAFIQDEHTQTIALILAHLSPGQAAQVLAGLAPEKQVQVARRIAMMGDTTPEALRQVERTMESRLSAVMSEGLRRTGDVGTAAEILNLTDRNTEKAILDALQEEAPELAREIRRRMFVFEDIIFVDDRGIQLVAKEFSPEDWALALKTASPELKEKIYRNLSDRAVAIIEDEAEYLGAVRIRDVEAAQQRIVDAIRRLEGTGDLIIEGRTQKEQVVI